MTQDVLLTISGVQSEVGDEAIELVTEANYYFKNGKHYVLYEEQPEDHGPITKSMLRFDDKRFEMNKKGALNSNLVFAKDAEHAAMYETPVGPLEVLVKTSRYDYCFEEQCLTADIGYSLEINSNYVSECEVHVKIVPGKPFAD